MTRTAHAYLLSMDVSLDWEDIARLSGMANASSAIAAVSRFCRVTGAAQPPKRKCGRKARR